MNIEKLISKRDELSKSISKIDREISSINDGYFYATEVAIYGSTNISKPTNYYSANANVEEYTGENGIGTIYTTNKNMINHINPFAYCRIYLVQSEDHYEKWLIKDKLNKTLEKYSEQLTNTDVEKYKSRLVELNSIEDPILLNIEIDL